MRTIIKVIVKTFWVATTLYTLLAMVSVGLFVSGYADPSGSMGTSALNHLAIVGIIILSICFFKLESLKNPPQKPSKFS